MIDLATVETDLKNYKLMNEAVIIKKANTIGFGGKPGGNIPVLPLGSYVEIRGTGGRHVMASIDTTDPISRGQTGTFDPKNTTALSTRSFMDEPAKADEAYTDAQLQTMYDTWLARMRREDFDPKVIPFASEIFDSKLSRIEHFVRRAFFLSVKNAGASNGGTSTDLIDGYVKQIADDLLATTPKVKTATLAALTTTNAITEIEKLFAQISTADFLSADMVCVMSLPDFRAYEEAYGEKFKYQLKPDNFGTMSLHRSSIKIAVEESWSGKAMITPVNNLVASIDYDLMSKITPFHDIPTRTIQLIQDFKIGAGIAQLDKIYMGVSA